MVCTEQALKLSKSAQTKSHDIWMALGIHWNVFEWPLECVGMAHGMEWVGMGWNGPWNSAE